MITNLDHNWRTIRLEGDYENPVVVGSALSHNGGDTSTVRVRNVRATSFDVRLQEFECQDGPHTTETLGWLVMERGHWDLGDGLEVEAGTVEMSNTRTRSPFNFNWHTLQFQEAFGAAPVVTSVLNTFEGGDAAATWHHDVRADRTLITMVERGNNSDGHAVETIGYLAGLPGSGTHGGRRWTIGRTGRVVTHEWRRLDFQQGFPRTPTILADFQSQFGGDSCTVRIRAMNANRFETQVEETCDNNGPHTTEIIGWLAFEPEMRFNTGGQGARFAEQGTHTTQIIDFGQRVEFGSFTVEAELNGELIGLQVQVSNDNFENILRQVGITAREGSNEFDETEALPAARYLRVVTILRTRNRARSPVLHGYALDVTLPNTIDFAGANLVNIGKINANLYDPVYRIDGEFHATYLPESPEALVELRGRGKLVGGEAYIDLAGARQGSREWLFSKIAADVHAIVTPMGPAMLYVEAVSPEALIVRSYGGKADVPFFYQLTGRRGDLEPQETTAYRGDPAEVSTAIDPIRRRIWRKGDSE